jgi:hypothetical protein
MSWCAFTHSYTKRIEIGAKVLSSEHSGKQRAMNFMLDIAVSLSPQATKARLTAYRLANP